ncbi:MAG TPA: universal stress protein [Gammaproteobacteria bacterium]|nr:universal stress protein [Gammaproteobacteria bacterium]
MPRRIVTAVDGSENAQRAVEAASDLAKTHNADLYLVHVVGSGPIPEALAHMAEIEHMTEAQRSSAPQNVANVFGNLATAERAASSPAVAHEIHQALGQRLLKGAAASAREKGARSVEVMLCEGNPAHAILDAAKKIDADLIVLGTRGLSNLKGLLLGSVSHKVIQLSTCSCLVVK